MIPLSRFPKLDLHGEYAVTAYTSVHTFLLENIHLGNEYVIIIHGKGSGKLKKEVLTILSKEPQVLEYHVDPFNLGQTLVRLNLSRKK